MILNKSKVDILLTYIFVFLAATSFLIIEVYVLIVNKTELKCVNGYPDYSIKIGIILFEIAFAVLIFSFPARAFLLKEHKFRYVLSVFAIEVIAVIIAICVWAITESLLYNDIIGFLLDNTKLQLSTVEKLSYILLLPYTALIYPILNNVFNNNKRSNKINFAISIVTTLFLACIIDFCYVNSTLVKCNSIIGIGGEDMPSLYYIVCENYQYLIIYWIIYFGVCYYHAQFPDNKSNTVASVKTKNTDE